MEEDRYSGGNSVPEEDRMIPTPFGQIAFMLQSELSNGEVYNALSGDILKTVDSFITTVRTYQAFNVKNRAVKLCLVIVPPLNSLSEEEQAKAAAFGPSLEGIVFTLKTWIGETGVSSIEEFLKEKDRNEGNEGPLTSGNG